MERNICRKKTFLVCSLLFCLWAFFAVLFFPCDNVYAVDGSGTLHTFNNWNSYFDNGWHFNYNDGVVSLPYTILNSSNQSNKSLSWSRLDVNWGQADYLGSTNNIYNTINFKFVFRESSTESWVISEPTFSPSLGVRISDGSTKQGSCVSSVNVSDLEITCSVVLENHTVATGINFVTGPSSSSTDVLINIPRTSNTSMKVVVSVSYSFTGASDPNTALLQQQNVLQQETNEHLTEINNTINNIYDNQKEEYEEQSSDLQSDINGNVDLINLQTRTTNIISIIDQFLGVVSHPTKTDCIIDVDLSNYSGGGHNNVDLCHLSPPVLLVDVLNVVLVMFVVGLALMMVYFIIHLYERLTSN